MAAGDVIGRTKHSGPVGKETNCGDSEGNGLRPVMERRVTTESKQPIKKISSTKGTNRHLSDNAGYEVP
jgi:hypothetical protein